MEQASLSASRGLHAIGRTVGGLLPRLCMVGLCAVAMSGCGGSNTSDVVTGPGNTNGPVIASVQFVDVDGNGVDQSDIVVVTFDVPVMLVSETVSSFDFDSVLDTLGTGPRQSQSVPGSTRIEIQLGASPSFQVTTSRLNVKSNISSNVRSTSNVSVSPKTASVIVADVTTTAPTLIDAEYDDVDGDGTVNAGDTIVCEFDQPIAIPNGQTVAGNFALPVATDSFGTTPTLTSFSDASGNRAALITLGATPVVTMSGTFDAAVLTAGSPSGLQMSTPAITDVNGANTVTDATAVDIGIKASKRFYTGEAASAFPGNLDEASGDVTANGFFSAEGVHHFDGTVTVGGTGFAIDFLFVADTANHRVLIFDGNPSGNNATATVALGQPNLSSNLPNMSDADDPAPTSGTLWSPTDVHFDGAENQLYVADSGNNRVLVFDNVVNSSGLLDLSNGVAADRVLGQTSFTARDPNQGGNSSTSRTLSNPRGVHVEDGQVAVADTDNHRVLIWSSIPSSSNQAASTVLGQPTFVDNLDNQGGVVGASRMSSPEDVFLDAGFGVNTSAGSVLVADTGNNRVLVFETASPASGADADTVLGQALMTASAAATTAAGLDSPTGVYGIEGGTDRIYVADHDNSRVMVYSFDDTVGGDLTNAEVGVAIGQANDTTGTSNQGGTPGFNTMSQPQRVTVTGGGTTTQLFVADTDNHRVLDFMTLPTANNTAANLFQGQPTASTSQAKGHLMNHPTAVAISGGMFLVCDSLNSRVLIYSNVPTAGNPTPNFVVGQLTFFDTLANRGGAAALDTLSSPEGVATDGTRLIVADTANNRVLIFNTIPAANGATADVVLGQANGTTTTVNTGGLSGATMNAPTALFVNGTQLFVCDRENHRVLVFNDLTTAATGASADLVIGQDDLVSNLPNHGTEVRDDSFIRPGGVLVVGSRMYVADTGNNRVLGWLAVPTTNGESADFVIGQSNLFADGAASGSRRLSGPLGLASDGTGMVIADAGNHRVLFYDSVPAVTSSTATSVLGQTTFNTTSANQGNADPTAASLYGPAGLFFNGTDIWVADQKNSRVVRFR